MHRRKRGAELVQPITRFLEARFRGISLQGSKHMSVRATTCRTEDEPVARSRSWFEVAQKCNELRRDRDLSLPICFRGEIVLRLPTHVNRTRVKVHVVPDAIHCFLLPEPCHKEELVED